MRDVLYRIEAALVWLAYQLFAHLPVDWASALGGWIGRRVGPRLKVSDLARDNLRRALPGVAVEPTIRAMWDNLGRSAGEFPHADLFRDDPGRLEIDGFHHLENLKRDQTPVLLFSGHIGNWELSYALGARAGLKVNPVYRAPDNPHLTWLFAGRSRTSKIEMIPKGAAGARQTIKLLRAGELVAMFVDQKMNDGIALPFFGRMAMTAPALASLAIKFDRPVVPFRVIRLQGARFRAEVLPPFRFEVSGDPESDVAAAMTRVNQIIEGWIRDYPAQWLWVHRRWPKEET